MEGLLARLRGAAEALGDTADVESAWLRGAAELLERGAPDRGSARAAAVWLDELAPEARARKTSLLSAWVNAAEALRSAIHAREPERGPLAEALFPTWRGPALRRHIDQALAAQAELTRRLASGYVARRLAEAGTEPALRPALEALQAAAEAWAAERDRAALARPQAETVRARLLAVAEHTARMLERVRWVVRAALAERPDLVEQVFPPRARSPERTEVLATTGEAEAACGSAEGSTGEGTTSGATEHGSGTDGRGESPAAPARELGSPGPRSRSTTGRASRPGTTSAAPPAAEATPVAVRGTRPEAGAPATAARPPGSDQAPSPVKRRRGPGPRGNSASAAGGGSRGPRRTGTPQPPGTAGTVTAAGPPADGGRPRARHTARPRATRRS